jgi:hypothetical protein
MLRAGITYEEIGKRFGISKGRVAQIVAENDMKVKTALVRDEKLSRELVQQDIDVRNQLVKMNQYYLNLLGLFTAAVDGDSESLSRLDDLGVSNKVDTLLKAMKDTVTQLESYTKIGATLFNLQQVHDFQQRVIQAIKNNCDKQTTRKIINELREYKSLKHALKVN